MGVFIELALRAVVIGVGATLVMDVWALALRRLGVRSLDMGLLGRWIGHLRRGRWAHARIADAAPIAHERLIGWCAHYTIGVTFAGLLLALYGLGWARSPSLGPAIVIGLATVVAPLFVLQPALGLGVASSKTPTPAFNAVKSVVTHTVFGLGLYLAAAALAALAPVTTR
ncbi:MAG: DUF2938 domain-containing protein [Deltaproteobacteria bacterium]|nr:DUF2938 domain-containing protein [Deltaproteobacteria bacterium]